MKHPHELWMLLLAIPLLLPYIAMCAATRVPARPDYDEIERLERELYGDPR